ncbi:hypothetical protein BGX31_004986, partial [Mortierella sp. GBA43]
FTSTAMSSQYHLESNNSKTEAYRRNGATITHCKPQISATDPEPSQPMPIDPSNIFYATQQVSERGKGN